VVGVSDDLIGLYLKELRAKLRVKDAGLIVAEAEDHLRETAAAGRAIGMTDIEAQEAAISAFGPVRAVTRAHRASRLLLAGDLVLAAWKLGWTGMLAIAGSGLVASALNHFFGPNFVGQAPAGASYPAARCQYWLSIWHGARTCAQAATLESSSDAVSLRVIGGGVAGLLLLAGYLAARRLRRRAGGTSGSALPQALFPLAAVAVFGLGALGLAGVAVTNGAGIPVGVPSGPGAYYSGAAAALAVAAGYAPAARRALRLLR
jgi:HAAS domain-containing protein